MCENTVFPSLYHIYKFIIVINKRQLYERSLIVRNYCRCSQNTSSESQGCPLTAC